MTDRRAFVAGTLSCLAAPLAAGAQPARKVWRIGWLSAFPVPPDLLVAADEVIE